MIDIQSETLVTLRQAAQHLPARRGGRPTHAATLARWIDDGIDGLRLEGLRVGAVRCTSIEAMQRFFDRLTHREDEGNGRG